MTMPISMIASCKSECCHLLGYRAVYSVCPRCIPEDDNIHKYRCENLKSYFVNLFYQQSKSVVAEAIIRNEPVINVGA
jgi:hypothetical protein